MSSKRPSLGDVEAGARVLFAEGQLHGWWPSSIPSYDKLDPVGKNEFDAIIERILIAAKKY